MEPGSQRIGNYALGPELGRGGSGVVYRAQREGTFYAVKLLANATASTRLQFRREAAAVARLRHPGLVDVVELAEEDGQLYLVMDLASGENLAAQLARSALSDDRAADIGAQLADALAEVHRHGLVHRDVKPDNVVVNPDGSVKLLDFGLVGEASEAGAVGTLAYAPPEQLGVVARPVGPAGDLYALGATLFECLAGHPPRDATDPSRFMHQVATEPAPSLAWVRPNTRPGLVAIIDRLLKTDPDDRYQSAHLLAGDLRDLRGVEERLRENHPAALAASRPAVNTRFDMVGRARERQAMADAWAQARGGEVNILPIVGEAGSGKTRLSSDFSAQAASQGAIVVRCKCQQVDRTPFSAVREAADHLAQQLGSMPPGPRRALVEHIRRSASDSIGLFAAVSSTLAELLSPEEVADGTEPTAERERFLRALAQLFASVASESTPVLWIVDDVQWLDPDSVQVFAYLSRLPGPQHLLVLALSRPPNPGSTLAFLEIDGLRAADTVQLSPLSPSEVAELTRQQLGGRGLPANIDQKIARATRGNPFAIGEYVRALLNSGSLQVRPEGWAIEATDLDALGLPDDIIELVLRRLSALEPIGLQVLHAVAILGRPAAPPLLAEVLNEPVSAVVAHCDQLVAEGFLERDPSGVVAFHHDRIREAVASRQEPSAARALHQAVADALIRQGGHSNRDLYALAHHLAAGEVDANPGAVIHANLIAGKTALDEHAYQRAFDSLTLAERLRAEGTELPAAEQRDLLIALGRAAAMTGHLDVAIASLSGAQELVTSSEQAFELQYLMTLTYASQGRNDDALAALYRSFEIAGRPFPRSILAQLVGLLWCAATGLVTYGLGLAKPAIGQELSDRLVTSRLHYAGTMLALFDGDTFLMVQFIVRDFLNVQRLGPCPERAIATTVYGAVLGTLQLRPLMLHFTAAGVQMPPSYPTLGPSPYAPPTKAVATSGGANSIGAPSYNSRRFLN